MSVAQNIAVLQRFLPAETAPLIAQWVDQYQVELKISKGRTSKYGDYRPPQRGAGHKISVNRDLNPYAFLVTAVHEFAHLTNWNKHHHKVKPHGEEWKSEFKLMMQPFFQMNIFPEDIRKALVLYLQNPSASSCTDLNLLRTLRLYDQPKNSITVDKLPSDSIFLMKNGRAFKKGILIRKRYRCVELATNRIYLFSPVAEVFLKKDDKEETR